RARVDGIRLVLKELGNLPSVRSLPAYAVLDEYTVDAVVHENARFVEEVVAAVNRRGDIEPAQWDGGAVRTSPGFREAFRAFVEGGWQELQHDPQWGGQGLPKVLSAAASETLNAAKLSFAMCPLLTDGVIEALSTAGTQEQRERYIPPMLEVGWTGPMTMAEPLAGSDLALLSTRAVPPGDGSFRRFGQKIFITFGERDLAEHIIHLVLARTPD